MLQVLILMATMAPDARADGFVLWQLPNQTPTQMMSYVIRTTTGETIVIDGGMVGDTAYLRGFLAALGNHVTAWFFSHPHLDHVDAPVEIIADPRGVAIDAIYGSNPPDEWMVAHCSEQEIETARSVREAVPGLIDLELGQEMMIDGVRIEVLGIRNPDITANPINNQSIILRVSDDTKSVLFTGDLGVEAGEKALQGPYADRLQADYVQMAHHGQHGVNEAFYQHVGAKYCLWPTPDWLWENDDGGGPDSGPWQTLVVREWMSRLDIRKHYVMADGLHRID